MPSSPPRPSRGPKTVKVDPEQILNAAQRVFARSGIGGSSIRAISREVGCDPALIYYHFENKEAMFLALLDRKLPVLAQTVQRLADPGDARLVALRLWEVIQTYRRLLADDAGLRAIIRGEIVQGTEGIMDLMVQRILPVLGALTRLIGQGVERGELRADLDPQLGAMFLVRPYLDFLDLVPNMAQRVFQGPVPTGLHSLEAAWFSFYWRSVAARPDAPLPFDLSQECRP
jgi:AcrR family transcriptional regulator